MSEHDTAWDLPAYEYSRSRFLEYTDEAIRASHGTLNAKVIADLKSFPSPFLYEQYAKDAYVGYIRDIKERGSSIAIEYEFDQVIGAIPAAQIKDLATALGISPALVNEGGAPGRLEEIRFKVAFSFPRELRNYVKAVSDVVKRSLPAGSVFYDEDFIAQLARPNLDSLLQAVYLRHSDLIVVFLSADYERKLWVRDRVESGQKLHQQSKRRTCHVCQSGQRGCARCIPP